MDLVSLDNLWTVNCPGSEHNEHDQYDQPAKEMLETHSLIIQVISGIQFCYFPGTACLKNVFILKYL